MSVRVYLPKSSAFAFDVQFMAGGEPLDLTAATSITAHLLASPDDAVADAVATLTATALVPGAGLIRLSGLSADTADLSRSVEHWFRARAVIAGVTYIGEATQGPLVLTPLDPLLAGYLSNVGITAELYASDQAPTITTTAMINRPDITGLGVTTAGATKLSGLTEIALNAYADGTILRLFLTGDILADYRLVTGAVGTESQFKVACDNSSGRYWQLVSNPVKQGAVTAWDADLSKFKQVLEASDALGLADAADAFVIPD